MTLSRIFIKSIQYSKLISSFIHSYYHKPLGTMLSIVVSFFDNWSNLQYFLLCNFTKVILPTVLLKVWTHDIQITKYF